MSIVRLVRHQLAWPPHGELRRKSVFASRGSECRVKPATVVCRARANRNPLRRRATHEETSAQTGRDCRGETWKASA
jgi:hypothetical protein